MTTPVNLSDTAATQDMTKGSTPNNNGIVDYDNEPPLLEELGIKPEDITKKFMAILT